MARPPRTPGPAEAYLLLRDGVGFVAWREGSELLIPGGPVLAGETPRFTTIRSALETVGVIPERLRCVLEEPPTETAPRLHVYEGHIAQGFIPTREGLRVPPLPARDLADASELLCAALLAVRALHP